MNDSGAVVQLGARIDGIDEVTGSNPVGSTNVLIWLLSITLNLSRLRSKTEAGRASTFGTYWSPHFLLCLKRIRASGV